MDTQYWVETLNAQSELGNINKSMEFLPAHLPLLLLFLLAEMCPWPPEEWSPLLTPPQRPPRASEGPSALRSVTVSSIKWAASPLPLPEGPSPGSGDSLSKAQTAISTAEWAKQCLGTMLFSMLIGINTGKNQTGPLLLDFIYTIWSMNMFPPKWS